MDQFQKHIEKPFQLMEVKKQELLAYVRRLPQDMYLKQPDKTSWSIGQAANHLYLSEKLSLGYLKKKLSYPDTVPPYHVKSRLNMIVYKLIFRFVKAKAPKGINMWEGQNIMFPDELDNKWSELRKEMYSFLKEMYPAFKTHLVYNHPFAGRLSFRQTLYFFCDHIDHHFKQIRRIERRLK